MKYLLVGMITGLVLGLLCGHAARAQTTTVIHHPDGGKTTVYGPVGKRDGGIYFQ